MKRRNKMNWQKKRRAQLSFARLEPRQLLAGDVLSAPVDPGFVGPVFVAQPDQICVVQENLPRLAASLFANENGIDASFAFTRGSSVTTTGNVQDPQQFVVEDTQTVSFTDQAPVPESSPVEEPIDLGPNLEQELEDGVYFNEQAEEAMDAIQQTTNDSETSSPVGNLARRQLLALIVPSESGGIKTSTTVAAKPIDSGAVLRTLATRGEIESALSDNQNESFGSNTGSVVDQSGTTGGQPTLEFESKIQTPFDSTSVDSANSDSFFQQAPGVTGSHSLFSFALLDQFFGSTVKAADNESVGEIQLAGVENVDSDSDLRFSRSVQIVESAIVLIGLPSSRVCREDNAKDKTGV